MNKFRVDRAKYNITPLGMNSLRYIGDDIHKANKVFDNTDTGYNEWNQPNNLYGLILSVWSDQKREYVVKRSKGISL